MPNAAHELADLLDSWRVIQAGSTLRSSRSFGRDTREDWQIQIRAARLLDEVDRYLEAARLSGKSVDHYLRAFPRWAMGLVAPDHKWGETAPSQRAVIEQHSIDLLRALGDIMESTQITVAMTPELTQGKQDAIDALLEALSDPAVHLREAERRYVYELVNSVRRVFEESDVLGSVDLVARVHELVGVMTMLAETLSEHEDTKDVAKRILRAARRVVPYARFGAQATAGSIGVAADLMQITGG